MIIDYDYFYAYKVGINILISKMLRYLSKIFRSKLNLNYF